MRFGMCQRGCRFLSMSRNRRTASSIFSLFSVSRNSVPGNPPNSCELETLIGGNFCRVLTDARRFSAKQNEVQQEPPGLFDGIVRLGTMGAVHHEE